MPFLRVATQPPLQAVLVLPASTSLHSQSQNISFISELFSSSVTSLLSNRLKDGDGLGSVVFVASRYLLNKHLQNGGGGLVTKSCPTPAALWTVARQAPLSMGFSRREYWSRLPFPYPGTLPNPGTEPRSPALQADSLLTELPGKPN